MYCALQGHKREVDALTMAFEILDTEGTGALSKRQLEHALRRVWPHLTSESMDAIFTEVDRDHDGAVSAQEFIAWASRHKDTLPLFREEFIGFSDELSLLASSTKGHKQTGYGRSPIT